MTFHYDGYKRTVALSAHGFHTTSGNGVVRGYQLTGGSSHGTPPLWDMFKVDKISDLTLTNEPLPSVLPGYQSNDKHINPLHCQL